MKLIKKLLTLIIFTTFLVCTFSCRNFMNLLPFENHEKSGIRLTISISDSYTRTAKPESINWSDYDYMLSKDSSGVISNLFETRKSYDNLGNGIILPEGNYNLVLYAYEKNTENLILQGAQNIMLSGTNNQISFVMTPVSGGTGNLEITLTVPSSITNVIG